ncbi:MAG: DUF6356 family protein [Sphingomicrobium sp.]
MATTEQQKSRPGVVDRLFFEHPRSPDMSWAEHGAGAVKVGFQLIGAGCAALIHGAVPGIFGETASSTVVRIHDHIQKLNSKRSGDG